MTPTQAPPPAATRAAVATRAYIGLGANIGDLRGQLAEATRRLAALDGVTLAARSRDWRTPPWGKTDQPWFVNAAAAVDATLSPRGLLEACLAIETAMGRVRTERWGPRAIDLDLLAYGDAALAEDGLTLPHPRLAERAFVLAPLAEIAPNLRIGAATVADLRAGCDMTGLAPFDDA